jgi:hypothetical protein
MNDNLFVSWFLLERFKSANVKNWLGEDLLALATQGKKDIVFRFIIEYSSLRDFGP